MLSTIWGIVTSLPALVKLLGQVLSIIREIKMQFQKDPIDEIKKGEDQQKDAQKRAEESDDTGGMFGGETK